ncbi:MAG: DEAD/DEAH box helicase [Gammaproteobacteria bacterium]|nr:DEAD/DEAH box helicase [Gammaproteobacteria bacterium]
MNHLKLGDILSNVGNAYFARGNEYYNQGRVTSLQVGQQEEYFIELTSKVKGSGNRFYTQETTIYWNDGYTNIEGYCSCPVEYNCKHVAAACLQYQSTSPAVKKPPENECFSWIDEFNNASNRQTDMPAANPDFILYLLKPSSHAGKLAIEFRITRHLKRGGFGKGRSGNLENIANSFYHSAYVQPIDQEIGNLLKVNNENFWRGILLHGDLGFLALKKMIGTGRCYWLNTSAQPLQLSDARSLNITWQADSATETSLKLIVEPGGILLLTDPPCYLAPDTHTVGPLTNAHYSPAQLEQLLNAPTVPTDLIDEFSHRLAQKIPSTLLHPPKKVDVEEISGERPTPCLILSSRDIDNNNHNHVIGIRFTYGDHQLSYSSEQHYTTTRNNKTIHIWRDLAAEQEAIDHLESLGFRGMIDHNQTDLVFLSTNLDSRMKEASRWHHFLNESLPLLEQQGWQVSYDNFNMVFHDADHWSVDIDEDGSDWFDLRFDIEINEQPLALLPLISQVLTHYDPQNLPEILTLDLGSSQYLNIPSEQLKPVLNTLYELYDSDSLQDNGALRLSRFDAARLSELDSQSTTNLQWRGGESLRKLGQQLKDFNGITTVTPPKGLRVTLRDYQQQGLNWLQFLREYGFGGILADDMGLGKTVQTLAYLLLEKEQGRLDKPCLVVAPTSLMSNWRRETEQFAPALKVLVLQGPERHQRFKHITDYDLVLSTYPLLVRDQEVLLTHHYHALILDEAQVIKNPKAKAALVIRKIKTDHRLCLTGTPMENHLGELWALFDFLMPGFLGDARHFNTLFRTPIEKNGDDERRQQLVQRITPFMLRRTKSEVITELPDKTEIIRTVTLDKKQAALYESIRISMEKKVREAISNKGLARSHITILDALLKLRQVCCDPRLLSLTQARAVKESAKLELLMQLVPEMVEEGRRILLFSQFTKMLGHIETELNNHNIRYSKLTGQTRNRDAAIEKFKSGKAEVFLISLKAGGVGLNLTEADTVIHYDPWWNPAAENQATDRAHRIGQNKAVFVYKLITENSVEEKIIAMQAKKQALAQGVYSKKAQAKEEKLTADDLQQLFAPLL